MKQGEKGIHGARGTTEGARNGGSGGDLPELPLADDTPTSACERLLLAHLDFIERTVRSTARRHALGRAEAEDFEGQVKLRLIVDDYAVLRKFQGKSRLTTFLTTVIQNLFRDYRIAQWGKWRPSAAARRLGDLGVQLESLLYRDHFSFSEAAEILRTRYDVELSDLQLIDVAAKLRPRTTRRFENDVALAHLPARERGDCLIRDRDLGSSCSSVSRALRRSLAELGEEDRLILRLRFEEGLTIRAIAGALGFDPRRIYGRVRGVIRKLRDHMWAEGVHGDEVYDLLRWPACEIESSLAQPEQPASQRTA